MVSRRTAAAAVGVAVVGGGVLLYLWKTGRLGHYQLRGQDFEGPGGGRDAGPLTTDSYVAVPPPVNRAIPVHPPGDIYTAYGVSQAHSGYRNFTG